MVAREGAGSGFRAIVELSLIDWSSDRTPERVRHRSPPCFGATHQQAREDPDAIARVSDQMSSRGVFCRRAYQPTMAASYQRVQGIARWLDEPVALRSQNGRKTTRTAKEIAG